MADRVDSVPSSEFRLHWKWVGVAGLVLGIGSLGSLTVVATVTGADTLSTVALALAVLAFVIQILTFVAQTWFAEAQSRDTAAINAETKALLTELRTRSQDTNAILNEQYNKLLDRMLLVTQETVSEVAPGDAAELKQLQTRLIEELRAVVDSSRIDARGTSLTSWARPDSPVRDDVALQELVEMWPSPREGRMLARLGFSELEDNELQVLFGLARDYRDSIRSGVTPGLPAESFDREALHALMGRELATTQETPNGWAQLTALGRLAARLFFVRGEPPAYIEEIAPGRLWNMRRRDA